MPALLLRSMSGRDAAEEHRTSTRLELFFGLTFVVAVSLAAVLLAHEIEAGHTGRGVGVFAMVFFAVWWGWLNFTQAGEHVAELTTLAVGGLALLAGMWWIYFAADTSAELADLAKALCWRYGHYLIFGSAAAVSSGIEVQVALIGEHGHADALVGRAAVGVPMAICIAVTSTLVLRIGRRGPGLAAAALTTLACLGVVLIPPAPQVPTCLVAVVVAAFVVFLVTTGVGERAREPADLARPGAALRAGPAAARRVCDAKSDVRQLEDGRRQWRRRSSR